MFQNSIITTLNLEEMDTSNVSNMSYMFQNASAKDINLSKKFSFDSINTDVISWSLSMVFWNVNVNTLDFRGVDVKKIRNTDNFFSSKENAPNSSYGTIYVRSEEDAEWLRNNGTYNPNNFNYVVKQ